MSPRTCLGTQPTRHSNRTWLRLGVGAWTRLGAGPQPRDRASPSPASLSRVGPRPGPGQGRERGAGAARGAVHVRAAGRWPDPCGHVLAVGPAECRWDAGHSSTQAAASPPGAALVWGRTGRGSWRARARPRPRACGSLSGASGSPRGRGGSRTRDEPAPPPELGRRVLLGPLRRGPTSPARAELGPRGLGAVSLSVTEPAMRVRTACVGAAASAVVSVGARTGRCCGAGPGSPLRTGFPAPRFTEAA